LDLDLTVQDAHKQSAAVIGDDERRRRHDVELGCSI
jgi:hypothetical protein